jgi:DMSO reductase family type II enzyme chaperone
MNTAKQLKPEQEVDISRSRMYHLLSLGFSFPGEKLQSARNELQTLAATLYPDIDITVMDIDFTSAEMESEYINVFDGVEQKQYCKPYEGLWQEANRAKRQWEVKKFYHVFGLGLDEQLNEMPDHIMHELEFMHFLSYQMVAVSSGGSTGENDNRAEHFLLAQKDFLERHISQWVPAFCEHLPKKTEMPFYLQLAELTSRFVADDLRWLQGEA